MVIAASILDIHKLELILDQPILIDLNGNLNVAKYPRTQYTLIGEKLSTVTHILNLSLKKFSLKLKLNHHSLHSKKYLIKKFWGRNVNINLSKGTRDGLRSN